MSHPLLGTPKPSPFQHAERLMTKKLSIITTIRGDRRYKSLGSWSPPARGTPGALHDDGDYLAQHEEHGNGLQPSGVHRRATGWNGLQPSGVHRRATGGGVMAALAVVPSPAVKMGEQTI